jgi:hypothetical protein
MAATTNIANVTATCGTTGNGNGDGTITTTNNENILAWEHLSKAGFINGTYTCTGATATPTSVPTNAYGQYLNLIFDATFAGAGGTSRHNLQTGTNVPSDILGEIDRKVDDGNATTGTFRGAGAAAGCWSTTGTVGVWTVTAPSTTCGGATLF